MKERNVELIRMAIADEYGMSESESRIYAEVVADSTNKVLTMMKEIKEEAKNGG